MLEVIHLSSEILCVLEWCSRMHQSIVIENLEAGIMRFCYPEKLDGLYFSPSTEMLLWLTNRERTDRALDCTWLAALACSTER